MMTEITNTLRIDKLPSVNNMYEPILHKRKIKNTSIVYMHYAGMHLSHEAGAVKEEIKRQLKLLNLYLPKGQVDWDKPFYLNIIYVLKQGVLRRDLDNLNKCVIDAISEHFAINDSRYFDERMRKFFTVGSQYEYIKFFLGQLDKKVADMKI